MGPSKSNREVLRDAVQDFNLEYDYRRIDSEMIGSLGDLADDFMAVQDNLTAGIDQLTDAEIDDLIAEMQGTE